MVGIPSVEEGAMHLLLQRNNEDCYIGIEKVAEETQISIQKTFVNVFNLSE